MPNETITRRWLWLNITTKEGGEILENTTVSEMFQMTKQAIIGQRLGPMETVGLLDSLEALVLEKNGVEVFRSVNRISTQ